MMHPVRFKLTRVMSIIAFNDGEGLDMASRICVKITSNEL